MTRIRDIRVGVRLALAFGVLILMLMAVVGVGLWVTARQSSAEGEVQRAADVIRDGLELKFRIADVNGSEVGYAFEAARGTPGATDDAVGERQAFLTDAQAYRDAREALLRNRLTAAEADTVQQLSATFDRFMSNDERIVSLFRSGTSPAATEAGDLLVGEQVTVFDDMGSKADQLVGLAQAAANQASRSATDTNTTARVVMIAIGIAA